MRMKRLAQSRASRFGTLESCAHSFFQRKGRKAPSGTSCALDVCVCVRACMPLSEKEGIRRNPTEMTSRTASHLQSWALTLPIYRRHLNIDRDCLDSLSVCP